MSHTYECVICHEWVSHVSHTNQSRAHSQMQTTRHPPTSPPDSYRKSLTSQIWVTRMSCMHKPCARAQQYAQTPPQDSHREGFVSPIWMSHMNQPRTQRGSCLQFEWVIWRVRVSNLNESYEVSWRHVHSATTLTNTTRRFSSWISHVSHLSESYTQILRTCATTFTNTTRRFSSKLSHVSF